VDSVSISNKVIFKLLEHGYEAYRVGGCVRDRLLGRAVNDVDIATSALPEQVIALFGHVIPTGLKHGTVTVVEEGVPFEVTTFRSESSYENHRHPKSVEFKLHLEDDLARRDFTINAMAETWDGKVIDPYQGRADLDGKWIRAVGDASERMQEDALRMMRAVRFASQLGFKIDVDTAEAIKECSRLLFHVSIERIRDEMSKILLSPYPLAGLEELERLLLWEQFVGSPYPDKVFPLMEAVRGEDELPMVWALFLRWVGYTFARGVKELRRFRHSNALIDKVEQIYQLWDLCDRWVFHKPSREEWVRYILLAMAKPNSLELKDIIKVIQYYGVLNPLAMGMTLEWIEQLESTYESMPVKSLRQLVVNGRDVVEIVQRPAGPWIQDVLNDLLWQTANGLVPNDRDRLRMMLKKYRSTKDES
jgi:tRNA nucleotidyltransferase (CCA-adding enzyme)